MGLPGSDRGRVGQQSLKERFHGWFLHGEHFGDVCLQKSEQYEKKAKTPCINPLSTSWRLELSLSCIYGSVGRCEATSGRQLFRWHTRGLPGRAPSNFATPKNLNFSLFPPPCPGCWCAIKMVSYLVYPDMSPTTCKKLCVSSTPWSHTMRGCS